MVWVLIDGVWVELANDPPGIDGGTAASNVVGAAAIDGGGA